MVGDIFNAIRVQESERHPAKAKGGGERAADYEIEENDQENLEQHKNSIYCDFSL